MTPDSSDRRKDRLISIDAWGLWLCLLATIALAYLHRGAFAVPEIVWLTLGMLIKHFGDGLLTAHNYDFGSSAGSRAKDQRPPAEPEPRPENRKES